VKVEQVGQARGAEALLGGAALDERAGRVDGRRVAGLHGHDVEAALAHAQPEVVLDPLQAGAQARAPVDHAEAPADGARRLLDPS
jgi:hypothetical protein